MDILSLYLFFQCIKIHICADMYHIQCSKQSSLHIHVLIPQDVLVHIQACLVRIHESTRILSDPRLLHLCTLSSTSSILSMHISVCVRWVRTSRPSKKHKTIGLLRNTGPEPLENHSQHLLLGH